MNVQGLRTIDVRSTYVITSIIKLAKKYPNDLYLVEFNMVVCQEFFYDVNMNTLPHM